jgi:predicted amidophosphoribosyltransferase
MERCPACRARIGEASSCPRCTANFSLVICAEAQAQQLRQRAIQALADGDTTQSYYWAGEAQKLQNSPLMQALRRSIHKKTLA